jgi:hypothetical protein
MPKLKQQKKKEKKEVRVAHPKVNKPSRLQDLKILLASKCSTEEFFLCMMGN